MSISEGFFVLDSENIVAGAKDKPKVGKSALVSGSVERKGLANITNFPRKPKSTTLDDKSQFMSASSKEYINQLKKENITLMKLVADRNKVIELSGIELQKLRVNLQKMQQQNIQLSQSNSQMLAELNLGKDRLKLLQHELGCKKGLLVAKGLELEEKAKTRPSKKVHKEVETPKGKETLKSSEEVRENNKSCNMNRRQQSKSLAPSTVRHLEHKKADKRLCVRKQSARFKSEESKPAEDLFYVDSTRLPSGLLPNDQMQEDVSTSICVSVEKEDNEGKSAPNKQAEDIVRPSIGRPARQATKKVNSYKEIPLDVKMRRTE